MSYTSLLYHIVLRTKYSDWAIDESHEEELYAYIGGMIRKKDCQLYRINGMPDHLHLFVSIHQSIAISEFIKVLKGETSKWMKQSGKFSKFRGWGDGYCAISYNARDADMICNYIANQKSHHRNATFPEEFEMILKRQGIEPNPDYFLKD